MAFFGAALAAFAGVGVAHAQKVVIIDMQRAVLATSDGKKAAAVIDAKFGPVKADLDRLQKEITDKQAQFVQNRGTMNAQAAAAAQAEIESLTTSLKRKQEDAQQDLQEEENKELGTIIPKLQQIINGYASANQISFVVDTSANPNNLVFGDGSVNITAAIVTAYEKAAGAPDPAASPAPAATAPKAPAPSAPKSAPAKSN
jgi:outer membrane protein